MAQYNGNGIFISLDGTDVSAYWTDVFNLSYNNNTVEVTAGAGETHIERNSGLDDITGSFQLYYEANTPTLDLYKALIKPGSKRTMIFGPEGNTAGKPVHEQTIIINTADGPSPAIAKDFVVFTVNWQGAAAPTRNLHEDVF